ncbi:hypothetical protein MTX20_29095 [Bradyrhizobium sp. ISRA435]|nr:hypothetical protein MTX20_29095 [Bradyrhizobium sp. ISRA435]
MLGKLCQVRTQFARDAIGEVEAMEAVDAQEQHVFDASTMVMHAVIVGESRRREQDLRGKCHSDCRRPSARPSALWHPHMCLLFAGFGSRRGI